MRNERAWPQQCWKSCANGSNIVALRFGDHGTKEMLGVVGWKVWPVSNFAQQHTITSKNLQQGVQTDKTCDIQQCRGLMASGMGNKMLVTLLNRSWYLFLCTFLGLQVSIVGLERALYAYVKDSSHTAPFDLKTVPLATTPMQDQVVKPGKAGEIGIPYPLQKHGNIDPPVCP